MLVRSATHIFYEVKTMCYNCGCRIPEDDMGDPDNITSDMLKKLAKALKLKGDGREAIYNYLVEQTKNPEHQTPEIEEMFKKAAKAWGQSIKDAKKQTYNLLKSEL